MSKQDNGGPAFPIPLNPGASWQVMAPCDGMTLRDYFASHASDLDIEAMAGRIQEVRLVRTRADGSKEVYDDLPHNWRQIARYMHADLMLKARDA